MTKQLSLHEDRRLHLGVADHDRKLSRAEYAEAQFDEPWRYERVKGRLAVMAPAGPDHQLPNNRLRSLLGIYEYAHRELVECVFSEAWVSTSGNTDRIIDIGVYLKGSSDEGPGPRRPPELAFEIVSGGGVDRRRDYVEKREEYLNTGIKEYVIVDRFERRLTILRRSRGRFVESHLLLADTYTTPLLPGLTIPVSEIFS